MADGYVVSDTETDPYDLVPGDTLTVEGGGELAVTGSADEQAVVEAVLADDAAIEVQSGGTISAEGTAEGDDEIEVLAIEVTNAAVIENAGDISAEATVVDGAEAYVAGIGIGLEHDHPRGRRGRDRQHRHDHRHRDLRGQ